MSKSVYIERHSYYGFECVVERRHVSGRWPSLRLCVGGHTGTTIHRGHREQDAMSATGTPLELGELLRLQGIFVVNGLERDGNAGMVLLTKPGTN